ncbi:MAG: type II toxin-antitoxin system VapC family toxin [Thermoproteota archaeon]
MSYVFDASSILALIRISGRRAVNLVWGNTTPSLAYYEIGNTLWKEHNLLQRLNIEEVKHTLEFIFSLLNLMTIIPMNHPDLGLDTFSSANRLHITFYDAAYLTIAHQQDKTLITEDKKLATAAHKMGIKTSSAQDLTTRKNQ